MTLGFALSGVISGAFRRIGISEFGTAGITSLLFALVCGWLAFLPWFHPAVAWPLFGFFGRLPIQYMPLMVQSFPAHYAGQVSTSSNLVVFSVIFAGQWAIGKVVDLSPKTATGYASDGYTWALGYCSSCSLAVWRGWCCRGHGRWRVPNSRWRTRAELRLHRPD